MANRRRPWLSKSMDHRMHQNQPKHGELRYRIESDAYYLIHEYSKNPVPLALRFQSIVHPRHVGRDALSNCTHSWRMLKTSTHPENIYCVKPMNLLTHGHAVFPHQGRWQSLATDNCGIISASTIVSATAKLPAFRAWLELQLQRISTYIWRHHKIFRRYSQQ